MLPKHKAKTMVADVKSDINVTPLVDVCLVMLIIFMVVTPMLQKGVDVQLPQTNQPEKMPEGQKQLTISMKFPDGHVFVDESWVPDENLEAKLADIHNQTPDKDVVIKGDKRLKYKQVRKLMQQVNEAGFSRVGVIAEKYQAPGA
jgi:biopolymer transport protein TolR